MKRILPMSLCLIMAGCGGHAAQQQNVDPGPYPVNWEALTRDWLTYHLKDPGSIQTLRIAPPAQSQRWRGVFAGGLIGEWAVCIGFNSRNSFGGYTGYKEYALWMRNDVVTHWSPLATLNEFSRLNCSAWSIQE